MKWCVLLVAICLEVSGALLLKLSDGGQKIGLGIVSLLLYGLSLWFLSLALKYFEINVAYAIWSGLGLVLLTIIQVTIFKGNVTLSKVVFTALIITGIAGLNFASK